MTSQYRPGGRFEWWLTKLSEGRIKLDIKERLHGGTESVLAVGDGRIDMGIQLTPWSSGTYPLFDFGAIAAFMGASPEGSAEWAEAILDPRMREIFDKYSRQAGFVFLGATSSMANDGIWGTRALRKVEDFKGLKARTSGVTQTLAMSLLGASPLAMPVGEVFEALRRGTVDAITTSLSWGCEQGLLDICPYVSIWPVTPVFGAMLVVNADVFDALPADLQQALIKAGEHITHEGVYAHESIYFTYLRWIASAPTEMIIPEKAELERGLGLLEGVVEKWLELSGPLGKDCLRIASEYATGPNRDLVLSIISK